MVIQNICAIRLLLAYFPGFHHRSESNCMWHTIWSICGIWKLRMDLHCLLWDETDRVKERQSLTILAANVTVPPLQLGMALPCIYAWHGLTWHAALQATSGHGSPWRWNMGRDSQFIFFHTRMPTSTTVVAFCILPGSCCERPRRMHNGMLGGKTVRVEAVWSVLIASKCPEEGPLLSI